LEALRDRHGREPGWLRIDGRPVVFVYGSHRVRPPVWEYVRRRLRGGGRDVFLVGDALRPGWIERFDALHVYTPVPLLAGRRGLAVAYRGWTAAARAAGRPFIAPVAPGYDDRPIRAPGTLVERADGATYDSTWQAVLAADPAGVLIASWNEWHEGTEIEPSREHGGQYL